MRGLIYLILIVVSFSFIHCNEKPTSHLKQDVSKENDRIFQQLKSKYNPLTWEEYGRFEYTFQINKNIIEPKKYLIFQSSSGIQDFFVNDNQYFIKIKLGIYPQYFLSLGCSKNFFLDLLNTFEENPYADAVFVVSLDTIEKVFFAIQDSENTFNYLELDESDSFYGKGKLQDYKILGREK